MRSSRRRKGDLSVEKIGGDEDHMFLYARRSQVLWKMRLEFGDKEAWTLGCKDGWLYLSVGGERYCTGRQCGQHETHLSRPTGREKRRAWSQEASTQWHKDNTTQLLISNNSLKSVEPPSSLTTGLFT